MGIQMSKYCSYSLVDFLSKLDKRSKRLEQSNNKRWKRTTSRTGQPVDRQPPINTLKWALSKEWRKDLRRRDDRRSQTGRGASPFFDVFEEVLGSRPVVKMPGVILSSSELSTSSCADLSESDGDKEPSPEGKNNSPANTPPKKKARKARKAIKMLSLNCLKRKLICKMHALKQ
ncbi:hypothetical protein ACROYT_G014180 [Oculina patagonica]